MSQFESSELRSLATLLKQSVSSIRHLQTRTQAHSHATRLVQEALPQVLRSHVKNVVILPPTATLFIDAAVWAAQVRYHTNEILEKLHMPQGHDPVDPDLSSVEKITVKVRP